MGIHGCRQAQRVGNGIGDQGSVVGFRFGACGSGWCAEDCVGAEDGSAAAQARSDCTACICACGSDFRTQVSSCGSCKGCSDAYLFHKGMSTARQCCEVKADLSRQLNNWQAQDTTEQITESELRQILSKYAGVPGSEITKVEIVRDKACAFVEFAKVDAARRAIIASLLTAQGGGGGIKTDGGHRIIVESRKEKSERKSGAAGSPIIGGPAPQQAQVTGQVPAQGQQGQGQGPRRQGQNQNQQNQNQNQNRTSQGGAGMRGGRQQGRTGQAQGANQK